MQASRPGKSRCIEALDSRHAPTWRKSDGKGMGPEEIGSHSSRELQPSLGRLGLWRYARLTDSSPRGTAVSVGLLGSKFRRAVTSSGAFLPLRRAALSASFWRLLSVAEILPFSLYLSARRWSRSVKPIPFLLLPLRSSAAARPPEGAFRLALHLRREREGSRWPRASRAPPQRTEPPVRR